MKKLTAILLSLLALLSLLSLTACEGGYSAVLLAKVETQNACEVSFGSLKGTLPLSVTVPANNDGTIHYDAELAEGELSVYYDIGNGKELLFTVKGGEEVDSRGGTVTKGDKVKIIIETVGKAKNGEIEIDFD